MNEGAPALLGCDPIRARMLVFAINMPTSATGPHQASCPSRVAIEWGLKLTTHFILVPKSRMRVNLPARCSASNKGENGRIRIVVLNVRRTDVNGGDQQEHVSLEASRILFFLTSSRILFFFLTSLLSV